jgi:hypothetical protein
MKQRDMELVNAIAAWSRARSHRSDETFSVTEILDVDDLVSQHPGLADQVSLLTLLRYFRGVKDIQRAA